MNREEAKIERDIIDTLTAHGIFVVKIPNDLAFRRYIYGIVKGAPDLIVILPEGKTIWLEVKTKYRKPSEQQELFHKKLESLGHEVKVVRSVDDILFIITRYGQKFPASGQDAQRKK